MEDNKELVLDETENVEQTTEENDESVEEVEEVENTETTEETQEPTEKVEKTYSSEELSEKIDKAVKRREAKLRREYEEKYGRLETVINTGLGTSNIKEATEQLTNFYKQKGISIPETTNYNENDLKILAKAEAEDIINYSFDEVVSETDRLADKGIENMTPREKIVFEKLASYRENKERENELASIGAMKVLDDDNFKEFSKQFNSNVPIKTVYEMWTKTQPKPEVKQMGSMKNTTPNKVKDYYTPDEVRRLTDKDLDDPSVMKAVENSMKVWYEQGIQ